MNGAITHCLVLSEVEITPEGPKVGRPIGNVAFAFDPTQHPDADMDRIGEPAIRALLYILRRDVVPTFKC